MREKFVVDDDTKWEMRRDQRVRGIFWDFVNLKVLDGSMEVGSWWITQIFYDCSEDYVLWYMCDMQS